MGCTPEQKQGLRLARTKGELYGKGESIGHHIAFWGEQIRKTFELASRAGAEPISPRTLERMVDCLNDLKSYADDLAAEISAYQRMNGE